MGYDPGPTLSRPLRPHQSSPGFQTEKWVDQMTSALNRNPADFLQLILNPREPEQSLQQHHINLIQEAIDKKEECPIYHTLLQKDQCVITDCNHIFNKEALERWKMNSTKCPMCRTELHFKAN